MKSNNDRSKIRPALETLEERFCPSASSVLTNGVLSVMADGRGDHLYFQPGAAAGQVNLLDADANTVTPFAGVTAITFQGVNNDTAVNQTSISSTLVADGKGTSYLQGGTGTDVLVGSPDAKALTYLTDTAGKGNVFAGGPGDTNVFAGSVAGTDTITAFGKDVKVYDILGQDTIVVSAKKGYVIDAATALSSVSGVSEVQFFKNYTGATPVPSNTIKDVAATPFVQDSRTLVLVPQDPTGYSFSVDYTGSDHDSLVATYTSAAGVVSQQTFSRDSLDWVRTFGAGSNQVVNNTDLNTVFYGSVTAGSQHTLVSGTGEYAVLKGHTGTNLLVGRAEENDLTAGAKGTDVLLVTNGTGIFRNQAASVTSDDEGVRRGDLVVNPPAVVNGVSVSANTGQPATQADYVFLSALDEFLALNFGHRHGHGGGNGDGGWNDWDGNGGNGSRD